MPLPPARNPGRSVTRLRRFGRRFRRSEDGSVLIFSLFVFVVMLLVAGMAVDLMRFESTRSRLQSTLDGAVLASADLDQVYRDGRTPRSVVENRFDVSTLGDQLRSINVVETINSRSVCATADIELDTYFMKLSGVPELLAPAAGCANESVADIEVALVLDVSSSMGDPSASGTSKIAELRVAARDFVQSVLENDTQNRISIGIVPFNAQVNVGSTTLPAASTLYGQYTNVSVQNTVAGINCFDVPGALYAAPGIPRDAALPQAGYFDGYSGTSQSDTGYVAPQAMSASQTVCRTEPKNVVRVPTQNITNLRNWAMGLQANGNTSITFGMKWGLALLDPGSQAIFTSLIGRGQIPSTLATRPYAYDRDNTLKIVVLMTDGMHFSSPVLQPGYRTGTSTFAYTGSGTSAIWSALYDRSGTTYDWWSPGMNTDLSSPSSARNGVDDDRDGVVDDGIPGGWRVTPFDGTLDEDTDGVQLVNGQPVPMCQDNNGNNRDDNTGLSPCDDDDFNDDGKDDGDDADGDVDVDGGPTVTRPTWTQVWSQIRVSWASWHLYARAMCGVTNAGANNSCRDSRYLTAFGRQDNGSVSALDGLYQAWTNPDQMDAQLLASCAQAKDRGILVYSIAFEAPASSETLLRNCASTPAHYFDAEGLQITDAFRAIAAQINQLRLDQ